MQLSVFKKPNRSNPFLGITDSDINEANEMNMPPVDDDLDEIDKVDIEASGPAEQNFEWGAD